MLFTKLHRDKVTNVSKIIFTFVALKIYKYE